MTKDILLFDLGGVVVPWVGIDELATITNSTREGVNAKLSGSEVFHAYERGLCEDNVFLSDIVALFNLDIAPQDFAALWNSWVWAPYKGIIDALKALRQRYALATLTNNNALHWAHLNTLIDVEALFDFTFASHLIHAAKPDVESFEIPLNIMATDPSQVMFFDDTRANLEMARQMGFESYHVDRAKGVMPVLKQLTLI